MDNTNSTEPVQGYDIDKIGAIIIEDEPMPITARKLIGWFIIMCIFVITLLYIMRLETNSKCDIPIDHY